MNDVIGPLLDVGVNEAVVREELVRPLLTFLGYEPGEILPEYPVVFRSTCLRLDYLVEVRHLFEIAPCRIVVEIKRPTTPVLDPDARQQARQYVQHPAVEASFLILTNGQDIIVEDSTTHELLRLTRPLTSTAADALLRTVGRAVTERYFAGVVLEDLAGEGGSGSVYRGRHMKLRRVEAVKVLYERATDAAIQRFQRGSSAHAAIKHDNLAVVYDMALSRGRFYLRSEYVAGLPILEFFAREATPVDARMRVFHQVSQVVACLHENGVTHGDLQPKNVLVTDDGRVKVIDLDHSRLDFNASVSLEGATGFLAYVDPDVFNSPSQRDHLSDIYSLGLLLWSCLTGQQLQIRWSIQDFAAALEPFVATHPGAVACIWACIHSKKQERPASVNELQSHIEATVVRNLDSVKAGVEEHRVVAESNNDAQYRMRFQLWSKTRELPGDADFETFAGGVPEVPSTPDQEEFIFRCFCQWWADRWRFPLKKWSVESLLRCAEIVLKDLHLNKVQRQRVAHPAENVFHILCRTDQFRTFAESVAVGRFVVLWIEHERRPNLFFTAIDVLRRFQCMNKRSTFRAEATDVLVRMLRTRLDSRLEPRSPTESRQIGKLFNHLNADKCGTPTKALLELVREITRHSASGWKDAVQALCSHAGSETDELLIELVRFSRGTPMFEVVARLATGCTAPVLRRDVAEQVGTMVARPQSHAERLVLQSIIAEERFKSALKSTAPSRA